jgi:uncharacterized protein (TIGR02246 family)
MPPLPGGVCRANIQTFPSARCDMNRQILRPLLLALVTVLAGPAFSAGQSRDEADIRKVETGLQEAWNHHDMSAWANLFAEDADFVNVVGWWWKGRPEIERKHTDAHAFIFRESTLTIDEVHTRFLTPQIAVVHVLWSLVGSRKPDGTPGPPRKGIFTQVLQKRADKWLISAAQNTDSIPEVPSPKGPPADAKPAS